MGCGRGVGDAMEAMDDHKRIYSGRHNPGRHRPGLMYPT